MLTPLRAWRRAAALGVLMVSLGTPALAQTPFVPYFGKNEVRYDSFKWQIYTTDHFEIYYYPETEQHLERVAGYAESAYQKLSSELKHDLAFKIPLLIFKTQAEFQQQNVIPGAVSEGVAAFAEPTRNRMLLPVDEPPDQLYRLITHELTHIFEFDIIPRSLVRRTVPLWVDEGLADYMAGVWRPLDLMTVRDATVADIIPKMTKFEGYGQFTNPRLVYNLGHACFEFIESKWGKEGIRQYLFSLRKSVIGGGEAAYEEALRVTADEFDQQFEKYMKDRFKPFRDKERPADYGRDLAPERGETKYTAVLTVEPSPSGDLLAAVAGNAKEGELDVVLLSTKDRTVVRNLTPGLQQGHGLRVHRRAGCALEHGALARVGPDRRPPGLLRPHREAALAHPAERRHRQDREALLPRVRGRAGVAGVLEGRPQGLFLGAAQRGRRHLRNRPRDERSAQPDVGCLCRLRADDLSRRHVPRLPRAHQRQRQAVPPRPRHGQQDAADLRHPRRGDGAVPRRDHARVPVDGRRPGRPGGSRDREERPDLQPVDARPPVRRAQAVHRRAHQQPVAGGAERRGRRARGVRHVLQGRVRHPHARPARSRSRRRPRPTSASLARSSTSRRRSRTP